MTERAPAPACGTREIARRLDRLGVIFDLDRLATAPCDAAAVRRYYRACRAAYTRFHDPQNTLHVGLSRDGTVRAEDVFAQMQIVERHLPPEADRVLELATGRGANAGWLAARRPGIAIEGVDLSPVQLRYARRVAGAHPGYSPREGDFHDLSATASGSVDLAFVIDALCYSRDKARVLAGIRRVLRPGGAFLVFDGYATRGDAEMSPIEARAARLHARGMAVPAFEPYPAFRETARSAGLEIAEETDLTAAVIPGVRRFERLAARFLARPRAARALAAVLPRALTANAVSGYLFPCLLESGVLGYRLTVLRRPGPAGARS